MPQAVEQLLRSVPTSDRVRAAAFDAVYNMDDAQAEQTLRELPLADDIRAQLWDQRQLSMAPPPEAATRGMLAQSTPEGDPGHWQDRGIAGMRWTPPTGGGSDATRPDASLLGLPPELAVLGGLGVGRAAMTGTGVMGRAAAGATAAATAAGPAVSYEMVKSGLELVGMRPSVATTIALLVSGYRRGAKPSGAPASPAGTTPAPPAPPAAPSAARSVATRPAGLSWSPQQLRNEVGLAARRSGAKLSDHEYALAEDMVKQGVSPADAVKTVAQKVAQPTQTATARLRLNVAEAKEYARLRGAGKTHQEAADAILVQRTLAQKLGTPSSKQVQQDVTERNATGRWPTDKK